MHEINFIFKADPSANLWAALHNQIDESVIKTITIDSPHEATLTFSDGGTGRVTWDRDGAYRYRSAPDPLATPQGILCRD